MSTAAFAGPMLAIGAALARQRHEGVEIAVVFPADERLRRLFRNAGWLKLLDPNQEEPPSYVNTQHVPAVAFHTSEEQFAATNRLLDTVLASLPGLSRHDLGALEWAISEVTDNVLVHSESPVGGLVLLSAFPDKRRVELVVADAGVGMPSTLRYAFPELRPDSRALEHAVQEGGHSQQVYRARKRPVRHSRDCPRQQCATFTFIPATAGFTTRHMSFS